jgi:glycosyltransferase involved in cell wall biosynthesis
LARSFVSVLIDTYNHERFIEQAIVSVLEQDFPGSEREIIVVDDGSTDRTPEIVKKFEPRLRLLRKENDGQASAFNMGIPECKGEMVAFLDGDDWWAPGKLQAVANTLASEPSIGLVGHGITEVFPDGGQHVQLLKEVRRFRADSETGARAFRLRKSFLGTSRMTIRAAVLRQIGRVPEELTIQSDEYLFTLAAFSADVLILRETLTFYRLHGGNAFQIADGNTQTLRRKQKVLESLAKSIAAKLEEQKVKASVARIAVESIETEAELIRLSLDAGLPWETVRTEMRNYRIMHPDAPPAHRLFKWLALLPSCVMPSRNYYSLRQTFSQNRIYRRAREKWLPFLQHGHMDRFWTTKL